MNYSEMGKQSWVKFHSRHSYNERKKLMAEKGRKGWLALVARFDSEDEAKKYVSALTRANFFKHTRPTFARSLVEPYFNKFPKLRSKFTGEKP